MLLRTRIVLGVMVALVLLAGGFFGGQIALQKASQEQAIEAKTRIHEGLLRYIHIGQRQALYDSMRSVTRNMRGLDALSENSKTGIKEHFSQNFIRLKANGVIDGLVLAGRNGELHIKRPAKFQPVGAQRLMKRAMSRHQIVYGNEVDGDGNLSAVLAFPLYHQRKLVGAAAFLCDFKRAFPVQRTIVSA